MITSSSNSYDITEEIVNKSIKIALKNKNKFKSNNIGNNVSINLNREIVHMFILSKNFLNIGILKKELVTDKDIIKFISENIWANFYKAYESNKLFFGLLNNYKVNSDMFDYDYFLSQFLEFKPTERSSKFSVMKFYDMNTLTQAFDNHSSYFSIVDRVKIISNSSINNFRSFPVHSRSERKINSIITDIYFNDTPFIRYNDIEFSDEEYDQFKQLINYALTDPNSLKNIIEYYSVLIK